MRVVSSLHEVWIDSELVGTQVGPVLGKIASDVVGTLCFNPGSIDRNPVVAWAPKQSPVAGGRLPTRAGICVNSVRLTSISPHDLHQCRLPLQGRTNGVHKDQMAAVQCSATQRPISSQTDLSGPSIASDREFSQWVCTTIPGNSDRIMSEKSFTNRAVCSSVHSDP